MKVLQHLSASQTIRGGIQRVAAELVSGLNASPGISCDVLCQGSVSEQDEAGKHTVYRRPTTLTMASADLSWREHILWRRLRSRYGVVHLHCPGPQATFDQLIAPFKGALVLHWHSDIVRKRWLYTAFRTFEGQLLERADRVIVTSPKLLEESAVLGPFQRKCTVIPIGVRDLPAQEADKRHEVWRKGRRRMVFALGRLVLYKGFWYLIQAARRLPRDYLIVIAGTGPQEGALRQAIESQGLQDRVQLLGALSDADVHACMAACDVFCLPAVHNAEAFGVVQVEAMRAAKAVISTCLRGSGVDWVNQHGQTGLVVAPGDAAALAQAIETVCDDEGFSRQLGRNGRARYEALFTAEKMVAATEKLYRSLV